MVVLVTVVGGTVFIALRRWVVRPLNRLNAELEDANEYKSNFLTIVSHELRTPLAAIMAFSDILAKDLGRQQANPDTLTVVHEIQDNARTLLGMINNVIDAAKLEAGKFKLHMAEVDPIDVVYAVEKLMRPLADKKGIRLTMSAAPNVPIMTSDRDALHKILSNLLNNAVKFTDAGGSVELDVSCMQADGSHCSTTVSFTVRDTGIGIRPEDAGVVFERFVQSDEPLSRTHGGSGLGLSIVKELTDALGGTVRLESAPGQGSTFVVELPVDGLAAARQDDPSTLLAPPERSNANGAHSVC